MELILNSKIGAMFYISFMELIPECIELLNKQVEIIKKKNDDKKKGNTNIILDQIILVGIFVFSVLFVFIISD